MRAGQYDQYGGSEVLRVREVPVPSMRAGHVPVKVDYSSVNAAYVAVRSGSLSIVNGRKFPRGVGFDFAGEVVGVADDVDVFLADDGMWGFLNGLRRGPLAAAAEYALGRSVVGEGAIAVRQVHDFLATAGRH